MKKTLDQTLLENLASNLTDIWEDWNKVNHHDKTNGLSQKAVNAYRHEHPGSHLQTAVTTKPSKLKPGSKAAKRRKSFCARMSGNKGPMKKPNGKPTPKALALRRWHCESIEEMRQLIEYAEQEIAREKMLAEKWSQKYKSSINCSHPKGFSQKAHCAGKKKHEESMMTMETVCPDCGMCQTHGNLNEIKKGAKDSNGFTKCWPGHHAAGTKKGKNGGQVRNCVPNEGVAEAHDPKFAGFMNQALGTRQDKKPLRVDPKTVMSMNNMPGYKHAFKFGMDIIKKMDPDTKEHFANEDDDALESYMIDIAEKKGLIPKYFVEEDLSEVVGEFEEIFHDPEMEGWSWADLLRDMIGQEPRAHEKANVQAHKQMMAKAQAEKDNPPPIDPNKLKVVDRTDTGKSEIWYPSGGFFGTNSWAVVQGGFKDKAHAEHALKQLKTNPNVVNIIKKAIADEGVAEDLELEEQFNIIESMIEYWAEQHGVDSDAIWEDLEEVDDEELLSEAEAWQKSSGKNKNGGLNKKGVASYRRSHPGSHLQTAVTTKPSKLKKGSKAAKRRKSFCARMKGMKKHRAGAKTKRDPNSRINKSLRKWHCE